MSLERVFREASNGGNDQHDGTDDPQPWLLGICEIVFGKMVCIIRIMGSLCYQRWL